MALTSATASHLSFKDSMAEPTTLKNVASSLFRASAIGSSGAFFVFSLGVQPPHSLL